MEKFNQGSMRCKLFRVVSHGSHNHRKNVLPLLGPPNAMTFEHESYASMSLQVKREICDLRVRRSAGFNGFGRCLKKLHTSARAILRHVQHEVVTFFRLYSILYECSGVERVFRRGKCECLGESRMIVHFTLVAFISFEISGSDDCKLRHPINASSMPTMPLCAYEECCYLHHYCQLGPLLQVRGPEKYMRFTRLYKIFSVTFMTKRCQ